LWAKTQGIKIDKVEMERCRDISNYAVDSVNSRSSSLPRLKELLEITMSVGCVVLLGDISILSQV